MLPTLCGAGTMDFQRSVGRQSHAPERPDLTSPVENVDGYIIQGSISSFGSGKTPRLFREGQGWWLFGFLLQPIAGFMFGSRNDFCKFGSQQIVVGPGWGFLNFEGIEMTQCSQRRLDGCQKLDVNNSLQMTGGDCCENIKSWFPQNIYIYYDSFYTFIYKYAFQWKAPDSVWAYQSFDPTLTAIRGAALNTP